MENQAKPPLKVLLIGILAGILLAGTLAVASPTIAAAPVKIGKIWKAIKKKADKRYYTKAASDERYYAKAASDAKYAAKPSVIRGVWGHTLEATAANQFLVSGISFGVTLPGLPTTHYIKLAGPVPVGCGGNAAAPLASPGHLCVFEGSGFNIKSEGLAGGSGVAPVSTSGAIVFAYTTAAGRAVAYGGWALGTGPDAVWAKSTKATNGRPAGQR